METNSTERVPFCYFLHIKTYNAILINIIAEREQETKKMEKWRERQRGETEQRKGTKPFSYLVPRVFNMKIFWKLFFSQKEPGRPDVAQESIKHALRVSPGHQGLRLTEVAHNGKKKQGYNFQCPE
jgi:superoxide dismutase